MYFEGYFFIIPEKSAFFSVLFSLPRVVFITFAFENSNHLSII